MSKFGISMLDIYGLSFISAFFAEISFIMGNIVKYLTNTQFYSTLLGLFGYNIDIPTKMTPLNRINKSSTGLSTSVKENSKIFE